MEHIDLILWILGGIGSFIMVLLGVITFFLKKTYSTIEILGTKMEKAFLLLTKHTENIDSLKENQNIISHRVARVEEHQDIHSQDIIQIKTKLKL